MRNDDAIAFLVRDQKLLLFFLSRISRNGDCWEWLGHIAKDGYGRFTMNKPSGTPKAHRVAWVIANGPIAHGALILHACDNRTCVNPAHLFAGTHGQNMADMTSKGRQARGSRSANSVLSEDSVAAIRERKAAGERTVDLAKAFGVCGSTISMITTNKNWKHVVEHG